MSFRPNNVVEFAYNSRELADIMDFMRNEEKRRREKDEEISQNVTKWMRDLKFGAFKDSATIDIDSVPEHTRKPFKESRFAFNYGNADTILSKPRSGMSLSEYAFAHHILSTIKPKPYEESKLPFKHSAVSFYVKQKLRTL